MRLKRIATLLIFALPLFLLIEYRPATLAAPQGQEQKKEVTVWVNTNSGVYHCPGSRWYGKTKKGKYVGECTARKDGNRPAYGNPCGSDCK